MAILKSSTPYAKALFELAREHKNIDTVKSDINTLLSGVQSSDELRNLINNPTVGTEKMTAIFQKTFTKLQATTSSFLSLVIKKGRISELASICEAFIQLANQESNTVQVRLTTASAISDATQKQIASKVLKNANYEIQSIINPSILGGYVLEYDNKMLDESIANKIQSIKNNLDK